jgi:hypothetical protein
MPTPPVRRPIGRLLLTALLASAGFAPAPGRAERPPAEPFRLGIEREWLFLNQAQFRGTFEKFEGGRVFIRGTDGVVRAFWPGMADGVAASYLQRAVCRLPDAPTAPEPPAGDGPLIDLAAADLPAGPLDRWPNRGRLGGGFTAMNQPPTVRDVRGRKAVAFLHAPWLLPLEFETMVSDFTMPEAAIGGGPLTVTAWLYNVGLPVDRETFLSWGERDCGELDTPDFSFGCYEAAQWYNEKLLFPPQRFPGLDRWRHLAFVLSANEKDKNRRDLKVYVDGAFVAGRTVQRPPAKLLEDNLVFLGCAWEAWWGHAWATRPARPFTGAIAALQVFDRALGEEELRRLVGPAAATAVATSAGATAASPAPAARGVPTIQERLTWTPDPEATAQVLHLGPDAAAVTAGKAASVKLKAQAGEAFIPIDLAIERLDPATTYHWRVESIYGGDRPADPGPEWSFTTDDFDLEFDGPVSEAFPDGVPQDGFYTRFMEAGGYPVISPPGNHDLHLRAFCRTVRKLLDRRPDLVTALQATNAACHLASKQHRGWGWSPFTCSCYGEGEAILREGAIVMHEMGHQFHMQGAEALEPDFRERLAAVFDAARRERLWIGDYGGSNMWENVAVCASWWINDMTHDEGGTRPRELLRRNDPRVFHLLAEWWPGDTLVDLTPRAGVVADAAGLVTAWDNSGGVEYFKPNVGWRKYARTVGRFTTMAGKPRLTTVGGATAIAVAEGDKLVWDQRTWDALDGNRAWSVDAWVRLDETGADQPFLQWRTKEAAGARLLLGGRRACELPGGTFDWRAPPQAGAWHHVAWVYVGGGAADGPGTLQLFIDGVLDGEHATKKLVLPRQAGIGVGGGFRGAIGRLRVHDYALHPLQVAGICSRERTGFAADERHVGGRLVVDLDAEVLAPPGDPDTWPTYPVSLEKPWLRSWANAGVLAGKLRNDAGDERSRPHHSVVDGRAAVIFDGASRMVADFTAAAPAAGTLEAWVRPEAGQGIVLRWGIWRLPAAALRADAWQHVAVVSRKGRLDAWIDGKLVTLDAARGDADPAADRLIIGGERTAAGWADGFRGAIAGVRVHSEPLTEADVNANADARWPAAQPPAATPTPAGVVLDLDAADLAAGPVTAWTNRGTAKGGFGPATERPLWRPLVREVEGVRGVDFSGRKGLVSSFALPAALQGAGSFTIAVQARYDDTRGLERDQTMLSWGRRPGERVELCWGSDPKRGAFQAAALTLGYAGPVTETDRFKHNAPLPGGWRHIACVFDGPAKRLRLYVDGKRSQEAELALTLKPGERICLGGVRTGRLPDSPFSGLIAKLAIAAAPLDDDAIAKLAAGGAAAPASGPWLVQLDASGLAAGPLDAWENAGSLGGSFEPEEEQPAAAVAGEVAGRAAVTFDGPATLVSDIPTPGGLTGDVPFTVEMLVFNPKVADIETVFTLAPAVAMPGFLHDSNSCGAMFGFGSAKEDERTYRPAFFASGQSSRHVGWRPGGPAPVAGAWQHVACVNSGGYRGTFRVYVNGALVNERSFFTLDTIAGQPMVVGAGWNTARGAVNRFSGSLARLRVHTAALPPAEIRDAAEKLAASQ